MPAITRLEDLEIWQTSFDLALRIYDISENGVFGKDFAMGDQIRRAAISSMSNIAEGFGRESKNEFKRFLDISRGSSVEVQSVLHLSRARGYITDEEFDEIHGGYGSLCRRTNALIRYLKENAVVQ